MDVYDLISFFKKESLPYNLVKHVIMNIDCFLICAILRQVWGQV